MSTMSSGSGDPKSNSGSGSFGVVSFGVIHQVQQSDKTSQIETDREAYLELVEFDRWQRKRREVVTLLNELSRRERQILDLAAEGKTAKAAASELSISVKTVEKYHTSMMRKLKINSMYQAVVLHTQANFGK